MDQSLAISAKHSFIFHFLHEDSLFCANLKPKPSYSIPCYTETPTKISRFNETLWWSKLWLHLPVCSYLTASQWFSGQVICVRFSVKQKVDLTLFSLAFDCVILVLMPVCLTPHQKVHTKEAFNISKQLFKLNYLLFTFFTKLLKLRHAVFTMWMLTLHWMYALVAGCDVGSSHWHKQC